MDFDENDNYFKEKVTFDCTIKNCQKNTSYKIRISNDENTLGDFPYKETEELKAEKNNATLSFKTLKGIKFIFNKQQLFTINIMKKPPFKNFYDNNKRQTVMASLVTSNNSIYERKVNDDDINSEIFSIEVKEGQSLMNSENMEFFDKSILNYFKKGGKLKLLFFFDLFGKDNSNEEFVKSANIFYNLLVNFYNHCRLYTREKEIYIYKLQEIQNSFNSLNEEYFNIFDDFQDIIKYFLNCLNKGLIEKQLSISSFIDISLNEIEKNFFNIVIIFIRNFPEDIKLALDKIEKIKNEKRSMNIILINTGNKFSSDLIEKIKEYSNIILIENQDDSQKVLLKITQTCLNKIGKNIIEFKQNKKYNDDDNKENNNKKIISISENFGESYNDFEQSEENQEENEKQTPKTSNSNIYNSGVGSILENPYCKIYSIKESSHESCSEMSKKDEEKSQDKNNDKYNDKKIVDSKAKTDYDSVNNKDK